jgi:two-component system, OmpR family, sensor kinase
MSRKTTFRDRLTLQTTLLCLLVLTIAGTAVFLGARAALLANLDGALLGIARAELASALDGPGGKVHIHEDSKLVLHGAAGYEKYALIRDEHGDLAAHTANVLPSQLPKLDPHALQSTGGGLAVFGDIYLDGRALRAVYYPFKDLKSRSYIAVCAVPYAPTEQSLRLLGGTLLLALTACGLGATWGARRLALRLTDPLEELAQRARKIGGETLHERIPQLSQDDELVSLTDGLNEMLSQLDVAFAERQTMIDAQRQFLMDASHELRTPVSNLRGLVEVSLRRPRTNESYQRTLQICLPEIKRLNVLVNDLLTLIRAEVGAVVLAKEPLDLVALISQALQAHQASATERQVHLCPTAPESLTIQGDPTRLRQVLDNLLDNALRFAPTESKVEVTLTRQGKMAVLAVRDQGSGIAPEDLPHLFKRFWRADVSRNRATGGLGLGLAITHSLVEAHEGTIQVESELGQGTCFTLSLPLPTL